MDNKNPDDKKGTVEDLLAFILADIQGRELNHLLRKNKPASTGTVQQQQKKTELFTPTAAQLATQIVQLQKQVHLFWRCAASTNLNIFFPC